MAGMYHINGEGVTPCKAEKGRCPFGQGEENNHFSDAGEAMAVFEYRLAKEYEGSLGSVSKTHPDNVAEETAAVAEPKMAADLAAEGADPKAIRDALRDEHPDWNNGQVHKVSKAMIDKAAGPAPAAVAKAASAPVVLSPEELQAKVDSLSKAEKRVVALAAKSRKLAEDQRTYDTLHAAVEGRAYYYDYRAGSGKIKGVNPKGSTYFEASDEQKAAREKMNKAMRLAEKAVRDAQTDTELSGAGHMIPDDGPTIRVRNQAQKWLLENELKGQISDGQWENTKPENHWQEWSRARVIVDPANLGRNFRPVKDNYQLNATSLLEVVGDRMVDDVKDQTGGDYSASVMGKDLRDLRTIFKTHRRTV